MEIFGWVVVAIIVGIPLFGILLYNKLVGLRNQVKNAWRQIDVQLKRRHDLIPNLVEVVKDYMSYEQETLEKVMQARSAVSAAREKGDVSALGPAETQLRMGLGNLFALAEDYPDLKANDSFQHLQARISGLENAIADRREFYNESVNNNNVRIEQFPDVIIARNLGFGARDLLEFSEEETKDVDVKELFSE